MKANNKKSAVEFMKLIVAGKIDEAYQKYVNFKGKHHNMFFPKGFKSLLKGMKDNHERFPDKKLIVKHVLGDGNFVTVHSHIIHRPGESGVIGVHLFRFSKGKIVEMWDCGQPIMSDSPNKDGAF